MERGAPLPRGPVSRREGLLRDAGGGRAGGAAEAPPRVLDARLPPRRHRASPPEQKAELESLRNRLVELEVAFARNINEDQEGIEVTREGLAGLPDEYVERLEPGAEPGTYKVGIKGPELVPFLAQAHDRSLREKLFRRNWTSAVAANRPILEEALEIRRRIGQLFGMPTWAHYALEVKMAGTPERVEAFYAEIVPPLRAAAEREVAKLHERAERDGVIGPLQAWDWAYYDNQQSREEHGVDQNEVSQYLPLEPVIDGMFALTAEMFGLEYRKVPDAKAWHPDVTLYEIRDRASGELIAHFYADMHPRPDKYYHAAAFPLVLGHRRADGSYATPVSAIVANLTPPGPGRPSLLRHGPRGEIETLFHEFGHILHESLTRSEFARFSGAETERDFVEAPSQIMEHWVWQPEVLARFARHHATGEPLPDGAAGADDRQPLPERRAAGRVAGLLRGGGHDDARQPRPGGHRCRHARRVRRHLAPLSGGDLLGRRRSAT